ncbi:hypothetical protein ACO34A_15435 [Rhizobium sp. ACO-34A]|nr:hypothetical protein [Rhizobium sp. ACO-34A]ATN35196.1 hypothetical protein ACO34A_15435 [Rhizobium sp. ACO-34A]
MDVIMLPGMGAEDALRMKVDRSSYLLPAISLPNGFVTLVGLALTLMVASNVHASRTFRSE